MKKPPSLTPNESGLQFENQVASVFIAAGYKVDRNQNLSGQQVDLVITGYENLGLERRLLVECKFKTKGSVSNNEVQEFISFVGPLLTKGYSGGILVSNQQFSLNAKAFAEQFPFIQLRTYADLEDSLFDFSRAFVAQVNAYETGQVAHSFIQLTATKIISDQANILAAPTKSEVTTVPDVLEQLTNSESPFFGFILGDFGVGKTTIIDRLNHELQQRYLANRASRIPLVFRLNKFVEATSLNQYIESQLAFSLKIQVPASRIFGLCETNRAVVFLDGFDEIATNASEYRRISYFESLLPLIRIARYAVISSRPSYFRNAAEFDSLLATAVGRRLAFETPTQGPIRKKDEEARRVFRSTWSKLREEILGPPDTRPIEGETTVYYVNQLSRTQIVEYISNFSVKLRKKHKLDPDEIYEILMKVYDISDLMTRPLLLKLIVEVLLIGRIDLRDPNLSIGPAALYRMYIDAHLAIDWSKGPARHFLEKEERLLFAKGMALAMLYGDAGLTVSYSDIVDTIIHVAHSFKPDRQRLLVTQVEEVCTDVRVCAFLRLRNQDQFEFIHKSFMEYLVADQIREQLYSNTPIDIFRKNLNYEILYFLGSFALVEADILHHLLYQLRNVAYREGEQYRRNVLGAIFYTGRDLHDQKFSDALIDRLKFKRVIWNDLEFDNICFDGLVAEIIECVRVTFRNSEFIKLTSKDLIIQDCLGAVTISNSEVNNILVQGSETLVLDIVRSQAEKMTVNHVKETHISSNSKAGSLSIDSSKIIIQGSADSDAGFRKPHFSRSYLECSKGPDGSLKRRMTQATFQDCIFKNYSMSFEDAKSATFTRCFGVIVAHDVSERESEFSRQYTGDKFVVRRKWSFRDGILFLDSRELRPAQVRSIESLYFDFDRDAFTRNTLKVVENWMAIVDRHKDDESDKKEKRSRRIAKSIGEQLGLKPSDASE
jgi:hypothetical protein